jgi:putative endonuclease
MQRRTPLRMRVAARWRRKLPAFVRVRRIALRRWCSLGARGERAAIQYLENQFFHVWQTNVWINGGEIDIIASTKRELVFVEVKTRSEAVVGRFSGVEAVDDAKLAQIFKLAARYQRNHRGLLKQRRIKSVRCDVIEVVKGAGPFSFRVNRHLERVVVGAAEVG